MTAIPTVGAGGSPGAPAQPPTSAGDPLSSNCRVIEVRVAELKQLLQRETLDEVEVYAAAGIPRSGPDALGAGPPPPGRLGVP